MPEFVHHYDAVIVPPIERTIDDATGPSSEIRDDFFNRIVASFKLSKHVVETVFDIRARMLVPADMSRASDDYLTRTMGQRASAYCDQPAGSDRE